MRILFVMMLCASTQALAVAKGGTLYIKSKDTRVQKQAAEKGAPVVTLQPGMAVVWLGASEKDAQWQMIEASGKKGFVRRSDLTPQQPQAELDASTGKSISAQAFAASGANKCNFGTTSMRSLGPAQQATAAELIYAEELNNTKATPEAVAAKSKELNR